MNEELIKRIQALIEKGESIKTQRYFEEPILSFNPKIHSSPVTGRHEPYVEPASFGEWKTSALSLIEALTDSESVYKRNFEQEVIGEDVNCVDRGIGILRALKTDIEQGYLTKYRILVVAEVFDDFLEMAEYLLETDYKDPAASLLCAVLEDGLRQMCRNNNIEVKKSDDISCLNQKLGSKGIYTTIIQKQIQAWKGIRDSADHGKFGDYKKEEVQDMLRGVKRFLGENLK
jgi:hypothetical protein